MKTVRLVLILVIFCQPLYAQKEWSNWYYNGRSMLTFKNGFAQEVTNFINPVPAPNDYLQYYNWGQGGAAYSSPTTGEMKFIISTFLGFDRNYNHFNNDSIIRFCTQDQPYHIIPFAADSNKFYVIQFQSAVAGLLAQESGLQVRCPNAIGLAYSLVDLTLNNGLGDVYSVNTVIGQGYTDQITLVKHANGRDTWVVVHPYNTSQFQAFLFTSTGVQPAVSSTAGPQVLGGYMSATGELTASHDGRLIAGFSGVGDGLQLFDFDNASGMLSNYRNIPSDGKKGKLQFSPDNSKLYFLDYEAIYQYDFNEPNLAASLTKIGADRSWYLYDMQLAPDGKIYLKRTSELVNGNNISGMGTIECPNLAKYACNIKPGTLPNADVDFPDLVNDFINQPRVTPVPTLNLGPDTLICFGSYTIVAPAGWQSYRWNTGETTRQITVTTPGVYYVLTGNTGFSCPSAYGYVNVGDKAEKLNLGRDTSLCPRTSHQLHIDNSYTNVLWQNGSRTHDSLIQRSSSIIISATDRNGCYTDDTVNIYFKPNPAADFGADTTLCNNATLTLQLEPSSIWVSQVSYLWQDGSQNERYTVTSPGTYWGTCTYMGCTVSDTITVSYLQGATVNIGADTMLCEGDSLVLSVNVATATYLWNTGATTRSITVRNGGTYSVKVSNGACILSDTINVAYQNKPQFSLGNDTALCVGNTLTLNALAAGSYTWQDGSTASTFTAVNPGLYWLTVTQSGCSKRDSLYVTQLTLPPLSLGNDTGICIGKTLSLNAFHNSIVRYTWQDQSTQSIYNVVAAGNYSVEVTGNNGCRKSDTITVTTTAVPAFSLGADTTLCNLQNLQYNFTLNNAVYLWNDGSTAGIYNIVSPGTYALTVSQAGCSKSDSINVTYKPLPAVSLGRDTTLCEDTRLLLTALNVGATYTWQDNSTADNFTVTTAGNYFVTVNLAGCTLSDTLTVQYKRKPVFTLGKDTMLCKGTQISLKPQVSGAVSYVWQDASTLDHFVVAMPGTYRATVTNACGSLADEITVTEGPCRLYMPTSFTPNNDGKNDVFKVEYPAFIRQFSMLVYNRWGKQVYKTSDPRSGWDGYYNGQPAEQGSYVWTIQYTDFNNKTESAKGYIVLIR